MQPNATPRQQGRRMPAGFAPEKHQSDPSGLRANQHHGQDRSLFPQEKNLKAQLTGQKHQVSTPATDREITQIEINTPRGSAKTWINELAHLLEASGHDDKNTLSHDTQEADLKEMPGGRQVINQSQRHMEDSTYDGDFPLLLGSSTTSTPRSAQSPPTLVEEKYAPPLPYQTHFHGFWLTWCETKMDHHYSMAFQHHRTSPDHTRHLDLSLLAHHAANHHAHQLELAHQADKTTKFELNTATAALPGTEARSGFLPQKMDADGEVKLTRAKYNAGFDIFDAYNDGLITRKEFGSASIALSRMNDKTGEGKLFRQNYEAGREMLDLDEDGYFTPEEPNGAAAPKLSIDVLNEDYNGLITKAEYGKGSDTIDPSKDGVLTEMEFSGRLDVDGNEKTTRKEYNAGFNVLDINGNGAIIKEELNCLSSAPFDTLAKDGDGLSSKAGLNYLDVHKKGGILKDESRAVTHPGFVSDALDQDGDGLITHKEYNAGHDVMHSKKTGKLAKKGTENSRNTTQVVTSGTKTRTANSPWILIKMRGGLLVKANSTKFDKWSVIKETDSEYPAIMGNIQAYEVLERQDPAFSRRKKATPQPKKTGTRNNNQKIAKTTSKVTPRSSTIQIKEQSQEERTKTKMASLQDIPAIETPRNDSGNIDGYDNPIARDKDVSHPHDETPSTLNEEDIRAAATQASIEDMNTSPNVEIRLTNSIHIDKGPVIKENTMISVTANDIGNGDSEKTNNRPRLHHGTKVTATQGSEFLLNEEETTAAAIQASIDDMPLSEDTMMKQAIQASIEEGGQPITLDDDLNKKCPSICITNLNNSCYITNALLALLATREGLAGTTRIDRDPDRPGSALIRTIRTDLLEPIRSTLTSSDQKDLRISGDTMKSIRGKCQEIGWHTDDGQHCISDFLSFLVGPLGIAPHRIDRMGTTPEGADTHSVENMGLLHLGLPQVETTGATAPTMIELSHLIQKAFSPETDSHKGTTTTHMRTLSDTLIVHLERAHAVPGEKLLQRSNLRIDFPEKLPIQYLYPGIPGAKDWGQLQLRAVICHKGGQNINSGHFFTILRTLVPASATEQWVKVDDLCPKSIEVVKDKDWLQNESIQSGAHTWIYERDPSRSMTSETTTQPHCKGKDEGPIQIWVETGMTTGTITLHLPETSTLSSLQNSVQVEMQMPEGVQDNFYLSFNSIPLYDPERTLAAYGIKRNSTIQLNLRQRGGVDTQGGITVDETKDTAQDHQLRQRDTHSQANNRLNTDSIEMILARLPWDAVPRSAMINQEWASTVVGVRGLQQTRSAKLFSLINGFLTWRSHVIDQKLTRERRRNSKAHENSGGTPIVRTEPGAILSTLKLSACAAMAYIEVGGGPIGCRKDFGPPLMTSICPHLQQTYWRIMWSRLEEGSNWADLILDESTMQRYKDPYDHDEVSYCMEHIGPPADARGLQIQDARIRNNFRTDQDLAGSIFRMFTTDLSPPLNRQAINRLRELQIAQDTCHLRFNQVIEDLTAHSGSRPQVPTKTHDNEQQRVRDWFHAAQGNLVIKGWKNAFQTQWSTYEHHLTLTQHRWRGGPVFLPTTRDIHRHLPEDMNLPEMRINRGEPIEKHH